MSSNIRVAITGIGPIASLGIGQDELWKNLQDERPHVVLKKFDVDGQEIGSFYHHALREFDVKKFGLDEEILNWIKDWKKGFEDTDLIYLAGAARMALADSGVSYDPNQNDIGLVATHENPGLEDFFHVTLETAYEFFSRKRSAGKKEFVDHMFEKCERSGYDTQSFMHLFFLSKLLSIHGFSLFVNNACASGLYAIESAAQIIKTNRSKTVVVVGIDKQNLPYKHLWLSRLNLYAEDGVIKPFAANRNGFVLGEGGAALVLENYDEAKKRGARIYAEYKGGDFSSETSRVTLPAVERDFYKQTIRGALNAAKISAEQIDWIVPHAIGTKITDLHEARSIDAVFEGRRNFEVTAFKGYLGHNLGSCALLETAIALMCMRNSYLPTSLNSMPLDSQVKFKVSTKTAGRSLRTCLKLSCGFAGYNGAIVLQS